MANAKVSYDVSPDIGSPDIFNSSFGVQGVEVTNPIFSVSLFSHFFWMIKNWIPRWYHVHIWQVSPQLSCGDTWQIWMWLKYLTYTFAKPKFPCNGEIDIRRFNNPHPGGMVVRSSYTMTSWHGNDSLCVLRRHDAHVMSHLWSFGHLSPDALRGVPFFSEIPCFN